MGPPCHPPDGQTVRGLGTTWLAARYPHPTRHYDRGTFHTMVTLPAQQWLSQLSAPLPLECVGGEERQRWRGHEGSTAYSSWPLASRRSLRRGGFLRALRKRHTPLSIATLM